MIPDHDRRPQELVETAGQALPTPAPDRPVALGRALRVEKIVRETADALSFVLVDPASTPIPFEPGQYFTVEVPTSDGLLRRAYSASSAPGEHGGGIRLTVKRMEGGRASGHLHESLREGELLTVLGPSGSFGPSPTSGMRHLVMVAGGSGITPMMSLLRTLLPKEAQTRFSLVYGSRDVPGVIFREELEVLAQGFPKRLVVVHALDTPPADWTGIRGPLDAKAVREQIDALDPGDEYLVCGPEAMMDAAVQAIAASGVPSRRIRRESFAQQPKSIPRSRVPQRVTLRHRGATREIVQSPGQSLLEAALASGERVPYSCGIGACGTCKARLVSGNVAMAPSAALSAAERRAGFVLQCVCHAIEPVVVEIEDPPK
ncbi:MAG: ferredoxin--NADP reductase [Myxococcales bacterium]